MKRKWLIISIICIVITITIITIYAISVAPHKLTIREETIISKKFDDSLDGLIIAHFSDVHYANFINDEDIEKLIDKLNSVNPDIILFSGDLIDHYETHKLTSKQKEFLIDKFKSLNARIGKYAVLGNHDYESNNAAECVNDILQEAGFIIFDDENIQITNGGETCFNLIGIDSADGSYDVNKAYSNISEGSYTVVFTHYPDTFEKLDKNKTDYVLAGHSHGGQVYLPLVNRFYRPIGCKKYFKGKYHSNNTTLDITSGVGLTNKSIRLFADAEVVFYKLKTK